MYMSKTAARLYGVALVFFMCYAYYRGTQHGEPLPDWLGYTFMTLFLVSIALTWYVQQKEKKATTRKH